MVQMHKKEFLSHSVHFFTSLLVSISPLQKKNPVIKQHDHYTGEPVLRTVKDHSIVTEHSATDVSNVGNMQLACLLQECPPEH